MCSNSVILNTLSRLVHAALVIATVKIFIIVDFKVV